MVKLPEDVVGVLDMLKNEGLSDKEIVEAILKEESVLEIVEFSDIMQALLEGYEAIPTGEELILEYYCTAKDNAEIASDHGDECGESCERAKMEATEYVLNELGVIIKGVNE